MGAIAIDPTNPDIIYAGTGEATYSGASYYGRGLLKSTDAGATWQHITNGYHLHIFPELKFVRIIQMNFLLHLGSRFTQKHKFWFKLDTLVIGRSDDVVFTFTGDTVFAVGSGVWF